MPEEWRLKGSQKAIIKAIKESKDFYIRWQNKALEGSQKDNVFAWRQALTVLEGSFTQV